MIEGWAVIIPASPQERVDVARALLDLALDPADVRTQRGGTEFLVPEALAEAYRRSVSTPRAPRGRPKKESR